VWDGGRVSESAGRPAYQQVADELRRRIAAGEFPVGTAIPSTAKLTQEYGVSVTVVRAAVAELRTGGVLAGHAGKGVFVRATPEAAAAQAVSVAELAVEVGDLRQTIEVLSARLADLYAQLGKTYPGGDETGASRS
jgi:GntR family transcriptional regulator